MFLISGPAKDYIVSIIDQWRVNIENETDVRRVNYSWKYIPVAMDAPYSYFMRLPTKVRKFKTGNILRT